MTILLDKLSETLTLKILKGGNWDYDLERIKSIHNRKFNSNTKLWEVPWGQLGDIFLKFQPHEILWHNPEIELLKTAWQSSMVKIEESEPETREHQFSKTPRDYQERYVRINRRYTRLLCAMEQGVGKTFSSLERIKLLGYKRVLVICPKVVCTNWRTEMRAILGGSTSIIYQGTKSKRLKQLKQIQDAPEANVIATYETVSEIGQAIKDGIIETFDQVIIDEAHLASNFETGRFKDINEITNVICRHAGVQALTGTPMQHRIRDIWGILYLLNPLYAGSRDAFLLKYEMVTRTIKKRVPLKRNGRQIFDAEGKPKWLDLVIPVAWKPINMDLLREYLGCIMFRVTRAVATDFLETMETVTVDLTPSQRRMYVSIRDDILVELEQRILDLKNAPVRMLRLLQAAEGLFNFEFEKQDSCKLDYIIHELDNSEEKIIVWSKFEPITRILGEKYKDCGVIYSGKQSDKKKILAKWAFNGVDSPEDHEEYEKLRKGVDWPFEPGGAKFFFGTIDMRSSLGMNLHRECRRQIFSSFSWQGVANAQAADRLRRIGQEAEEVLTQFLVADGTFEQRALELVLSNYNNTIKALDGSEGLSYKQIDQIIELLREETRLAR
jgi:hypothetical protein